MGEKIYTCEKRVYEDSWKHIMEEDEKQWFYRKMGIEVKGEKEIAVRDYMERSRSELKGRAVEGREIYPAARPFYNIQLDETDAIFNILKKMPKGGLLHVHSAAALSTDGYLQLLLSWCGRAETGGCPSIHVVAKGDSKEKYIEGMLLFDYQCRNLPEEVEIRPLGVVIREPAGKAWLKRNLSISDGCLGTETDIWAEFNKIFARIDNLYTNRDFYIEYHVAFFKECLSDQINYVELRSGLQEFQAGAENGGNAWVYADRHPQYHVGRHLYYKELTDKVNVNDPDTGFLEALLEAKAMADPSGQFKLRMILNARRNLDPGKPEELEKLSKKVDAAIQIKEKGETKFRNLVIGFDFVSEEDRGKKTADYADKVIYQPFGYGYHGEDGDPRPRIQRIDFFLHDGESCWKADDNMVSAAMVSKHRIGHGFNMNWFRGLLEAVLKGDCDPKSGLLEPVLEICPVSNQLLRYYQDIRNHSAYGLMKNSICCVIGNDDPLLLGNGGLSYDFWEAYVGMELPFEAVKAAVFIAYLYQEYVYSGEYGSNKEDEHAIYDGVLETFGREWGRFIDEVYAELAHGGKVNGNV